MRLAVLDYGLFEVYQNGRRIGIQGFLIDTGARRILVDTGFHRDYIADPRGACDADGLGAFGRLLEYTEQQNPHAQLALLGLRNIDITDLVISHGHVDHVGRIEEFPNATLWVSAMERAFATPSYWNGQSRVQWPAIPTQAVAHAVQIACFLRHAMGKRCESKLLGSSFKGDRKAKQTSNASWRAPRAPPLCEMCRVPA